ncbi:hypothetical protein GOODEAATRI_009996, partial [Goodea atripinnis]
SCSVSAGEKEKCSEAEPTLDFLSLEADLEKVGSLLGGSWEYWWWVFLLPGFWMLHRHGHREELLMEKVVGGIRMRTCWDERGRELDGEKESGRRRSATGGGGRCSDPDAAPAEKSHTFR